MNYQLKKFAEFLSAHKATERIIAAADTDLNERGPASLSNNAQPAEIGKASWVKQTLMRWIFLFSTRGGYDFWENEVRKVQAGGYVPPRPSWFGVSLMRVFCAALGFLEIGPIKVFRRQRLPKHGVRIAAPYHADGGDGAILSRILGRVPMWYLIRTTEVTGWRGWVATLTGAIAIDEETRPGRSAGFKAAIRAMSEHPDMWMTIFPQGQLEPDEIVERGDFKDGTMAIAKMVARKLKQPVWIVPIALHYKTDPEDATVFHRGVKRLGSKKFRNLFGRQNYGAIAVCGRPMKVSPDGANPAEIAIGLALPDDPTEATDVYVKRLSLLQKVARQII